MSPCRSRDSSWSDDRGSRGRSLDRAEDRRPAPRDQVRRRVVSARGARSRAALPAAARRLVAPASARVGPSLAAHRRPLQHLLVQLVDSSRIRSSKRRSPAGQYHPGCPAVGKQRDRVGLFGRRRHTGRARFKSVPTRVRATSVAGKVTTRWIRRNSGRDPRDRACRADAVRLCANSRTFRSRPRRYVNSYCTSAASEVEPYRMSGHWKETRICASYKDPA